MDVDALLAILNIIVGIVIVVFCGCAIPFGNRVTRQLATIETTLENQSWHTQELITLKNMCHALELRLVECEGHCKRCAVAEN